MGVAEPLSLWHELRAIVPGASTKAHCEILQPLVVCVVLRAGVGPAWVECVVVIMVACSMAPWLVLGPDLWYLCYSACSAVELSKLDMKNGPTIFWLNHFTTVRQYSISTVTVK